MMKNIFSVLCVVTIIAFTIFGHLFPFWDPSPSPSKNEVLRLASDAHLEIGDVTMVAPIAVILYPTDLDPAAVPGPSKPFVVDKASLRVRALGWQEVAGDHGELLCQQLSRQWSRSICTDVSAPLLQSLPYGGRITLADIRKFEIYARRSSFAGYDETLWDRLQRTDLTSAGASVACEKKLNEAKRSCTAAISISKYLIATWQVYDFQNETAEHMAKRQGAVIAAWIKSGLGATEDFASLEAVAMRSVRPE